MSYSGLGSYYTFSPHEVYSGMGEYYETGMGAYYYDGFGALKDTFNVDEILGYIAASDACYGPGGVCFGEGAGTAACTSAQGACNLAGQRANKEIQAALNQLGYGPLAVDGSLNWRGAYKRFLADHNLTMGPGYGITKQALLLMKAQLAAGEKPGPGAAVEHQKINGEYIPVKPAPAVAVAGMGGGSLLLAAAVVGGLGYLAYRAGKKKKKGAGAGPPKTKAMQLT